MSEVTTVTLVLLFFEELILGMFFSQMQPILLTICGFASLYPLYRYVILCLSEVHAIPNGANSNT